MHQNQFRLGPDLLAGFKGLLLRDGRERGGELEGERGEERKWDRTRRDGRRGDPKSWFTPPMSEILKIP